MLSKKEDNVGREIIEYIHSRGMNLENFKFPFGLKKKLDFIHNHCKTNNKNNPANSSEPAAWDEEKLSSVQNRVNVEFLSRFSREQRRNIESIEVTMVHEKIRGHCPFPLCDASYCLIERGRDIYNPCNLFKHIRQHPHIQILTVGESPVDESHLNTTENEDFILQIDEQNLDGSPKKRDRFNDDHPVLNGSVITESIENGLGLQVNDETTEDHQKKRFRFSDVGPETIGSASSIEDALPFRKPSSLKDSSEKSTPKPLTNHATKAKIIIPKLPRRNLRTVVSFEIHIIL